MANVATPCLLEPGSLLLKADGKPPSTLNVCVVVKVFANGYRFVFGTLRLYLELFF